jgi:hypothetical protein
MSPRGGEEGSPAPDGFLATTGSGCCNGSSEVLGMAIHAQRGEESVDWSNMGVWWFFF